jgi:hypothetical protein
MDLKEYQILKIIEKEAKRVISPDDLENKSDRTLLYGYTCDRDTWHVYIKDEVIHTTWYDAREDEITIFELPSKGYISNYVYIPNKRLYPECCDYEFCALLKEKGMDLPFTTWNNDREVKQFYGLIKSK